MMVPNQTAQDELHQPLATVPREHQQVGCGAQADERTAEQGGSQQTTDNECSASGGAFENEVSKEQAHRRYSVVGYPQKEGRESRELQSYMEGLHPPIIILKRFDHRHQRLEAGIRHQQK